MADGRPLIRGLTEVLLPSGWRVRGLLPGVGELIRRDLLPGDLIEVALRRADPEWLVDALTDPGRQEKLRRHMAILVTAYPTEQWDPEAQAWVPLRLTDADISSPGRPGTLDPDDVDALELLVRRMVPASALSEGSADWIREHGEVPAGTIPDWSEFRGQPSSRAPGADGAEVDASAFVSAGHR